jgi:hypothetical protein
MTQHPEHSNGIVILCSLMLLFTSCGVEKQDRSVSPTIDEFNILTSEEEAAGWKLLFDGVSFESWRGLGLDAVPEGHWEIEEGWIKKIPSGEVPVQKDGQPLVGGDIMTVDSFEDFELYLEWKISPAGNSGIKYNVSEEMSVSYPPKHAALGFEYQILDDELNPEGLSGLKHSASSLYDLLEPKGKTLRPAGEINSTRILFQGSHGEHWLNGAKVLEYDIDTEDFQSLLAQSKYKDIEGFAQKRKGHIVLQDHTDAVWFRNIKIRPIKGSDS